MQALTGFYFTDDQRGMDPLIVADKLPPGTGIIFRHYKSKNRPETAYYLSKICKRRKIMLHIAQDPSLAKAVKAGGLHLPEYQIPRLPLIRHRYPGLKISTACHSARSLTLASSLGADMAFLSPVFVTDSHPGKVSLGTMRAALVKQNVPLPVYALGGVHKQNLPQLQALKFSGFGAISFFENE
ncbi:MAG: thiamine phosphate synthase [Sneathiella sp.]